MLTVFISELMGETPEQMKRAADALGIPAERMEALYRDPESMMLRELDNLSQLLMAPADKLLRQMEEPPYLEERERKGRLEISRFSIRDDRLEKESGLPQGSYTEISRIPYEESYFHSEQLDFNLSAVASELAAYLPASGKTLIVGVEYPTVHSSDMIHYTIRYLRGLLSSLDDVTSTLPYDIAAYDRTCSNIPVDAYMSALAAKKNYDAVLAIKIGKGRRNRDLGEALYLTTAGIPHVTRQTIGIPVMGMEIPMIVCSPDMKEGMLDFGRGYSDRAAIFLACAMIRLCYPRLSASAMLEDLEGIVV